MKKLLLSGLAVFVLSCTHKESVKTYYLSENGVKASDSLTREEGRMKAKKFFSESSKMPIDSIYLDVTNLDTIVKQDSIIIVYKETYYFGKPSAEKLDAQKQWDNFVQSLMNKPFLDKDFKTADDKILNQKSLNNKPSLVNLWFTTCAPCIEEMPYLNKLKDKYKDQVNFVSITFNNKIEVEKFLEKRAFNFTHIIDEKAFLKEKNIPQYPINIFVDKNGIVKNVDGNISMIKNEDGTVSADLESFEDNIEKLLL